LTRKLSVSLCVFVRRFIEYAFAYYYPKLKPNLKTGDPGKTGAIPHDCNTYFHPCTGTARAGHQALVHIREHGCSWLTST
jgi:hypothetical protein